jgi:aryl-alcohol dehydrogenase-like predicted oxidoreductase
MAQDLPKMEYRFLGHTGLKVSAISLGGWLTYGGHVGNREFSMSQYRKSIINRLLETAFDCMKAAFDAGINFFDCAEAYSGGESSKVMGEAIKKFGRVQQA